MSSLAKHSPGNHSKGHRVMLNGKLEAGTVSAVPAQARLSDTRMSLRKRSHNAQLSPIELSSTAVPQTINKVIGSNSGSSAMSQPPPPLKPRIPIIAPSGDHNNRSASAMGSRLR